MSLDFKEVSERALANIQAILQSWLPGGKQQGKEYIIPNPTRADKKAGSFTICTNTGRWADFATGDKGGDLISLIAYLEKTSQSVAKNKLADFLNITSTVPSTNTNPQKTAQWSTITPIPEQYLKSCPQKHYKQGTPSYIWEYKNKDGNLCMKVYRFEKNGKQKEYAFLTLCQQTNNPQNIQWRWQAIKNNRPLYGLEHLYKHPKKPVLICEGEKATDAARTLLPNHICVTWSGGSNALSKTDFSPLKNRTVILWPDNDEPGIQCMKNLSNMLETLGKPTIKLLDLKLINSLTKIEEWPKKADAADAQKLGISAKSIQLLIESKNLINIACSEQNKINTYAKFVLENDGLYYRHNEQLIKVSEKIKILGKTRDTRGLNWGLLVQFKDPDNNVKEWNIPSELLAKEGGTDIISTLLSMGLVMAYGRNQKKWLLEYIQSYTTSKRITLVDKLGWHNTAFLLPNKTIGQPSENLYFINGHKKKSQQAQKGSLEDWQNTIGRVCVNNFHLMFAVSCAFASPLLELISAESGGFHFFGDSSQGKTTLLRAAASVYGNPDYVKTWRSTDNALESVAAEHSDRLLILDEISQCDPRIIGETVYMLGNGSGKMRANERGISNNNTAAWRLLFLSSGEKTLETHMMEANKKIKAGMDMRMLALPSDAGNDLGIFNTLFEFGNGAELSNYIKDASQKHYGTPFIAFMEALLNADINNISKQIISFKTKFLQQLPKTASGQAQRGAERFALIAFAGELAIKFGIAPWPKNMAKEASIKLMNAWLDCRGGTGNLEEKAIIEQITLFFERFGESRFSRWDNLDSGVIDEHVPRTMDRCGFRHTKKFEPYTEGIAETTYYVLPQAFKNEVCKGLDSRKTAKLLANIGLLQTDNQGKNSITKRLPGYAKAQRCYVINFSRS